MSFFEDKVILVTGAGGSIGSEISRLLMSYAFKTLVLLDNSELALYNIDRELAAPNVEPVLADVADVSDVSYLFIKYDFDIVFHAAAYKHVTLCEKNPAAAGRVNVYGTKILVEGATTASVPRFILISTDKAVRPTCVMGETKRQAEEIVRKANYTTVRLGNVWGSSGSVVPLWREQIAASKPVTMTDPGALRYFITAKDAARRILRAGEGAVGGEVFVPDMGSPRRMFDVAKELGATEFDFIGLRPGEKRVEELYVHSAKATGLPFLYKDAA